MPTAYRYEVASTSRAICRSTQCKVAGIKIQKGELRFGTLVTIKEHDSWHWKHWGCVTPLQIANIVKQLGGLDGLSMDDDLDILDGYDELPPWAQEKIKFALTNGHVEDEDWKGDPELNRPGQRGITKKRTPKKKAAEEADGEDDDEVKSDKDEEATPSKPKAKRGKAKKDAAEEADSAQSPVPKKKTTSKKRKAANIDDDDNVQTVDEEKPKTKRNAKKTKRPVKNEDDGSDDELLSAPLKKKGKKANSDATKPTDTTLAAEDIANNSAVEQKPQKKASRAKTTSDAKSGTAKKVARSKEPKQEQPIDNAGGVKTEDTPEDELADASPEPVKRKRVRGRKTGQAGSEPAAGTGGQDDTPADGDDPADSPEPEPIKKKAARAKKPSKK